MTSVPPAVPPGVPEEPSNRWPWVALAAGVLVILVAVAVFFLNRPGGTTINIQGTPSAVARASTASPGPPPTLVPPTLPPSANLAPTATPLPAPTPPPKPTAPPPTSSPPPAGQPAAAATPAAAAPANATPAPAAAPPSPAPTVAVPAQIANAGGAGNPRSDFDATYGAPVGETQDHFVVYRKNNFEYHVEFAPDPNGRAAIIVELPQPQAAPTAVTLQQAQTEAHRLLPKDAQPPNPTPEGNGQFVVERYTSQSLAQALPPEAFGNSAPGDLMIAYVKDPQGRITRWIVGPGDDPNALINQGR